ncbi:hypothetical protein [Campylobacter novaezeelandiae]|uniref:hypothetical protein n=1 Tax=Campylobacter novaezeelandiae TaxID=2267891 RepID=UPI00190721E9|nr:hypothetical protein [Campylobacter novaezeelandiae]MBK1963538.1 hypothetical protein [Campylobacter novaezeelandiae]MBK1993009.1 hypothetical protein [Campylobacter novaezeelandiae]
MKKIVVLLVCTLGFLNADFKKVDTYNNKYCFDFKEKLRKCNSLLTNSKTNVSFKFICCM